MTNTRYSLETLQKYKSNAEALLEVKQNELEVQKQCKIQDATLKYDVWALKKRIKKFESQIESKLEAQRA